MICTNAPSPLPQKNKIYPSWPLHLHCQLLCWHVITAINTVNATWEWKYHVCRKCVVGLSFQAISHSQRTYLLCSLILAPNHAVLLMFLWGWKWSESFVWIMFLLSWGTEVERPTGGFGAISPPASTKYQIIEEQINDPVSRHKGGLAAYDCSVAWVGTYLLFIRYKMAI